MAFTLADRSISNRSISGLKKSNNLRLVNSRAQKVTVMKAYDHRRNTGKI